VRVSGGLGMLDGLERWELAFMPGYASERGTDVGDGCQRPSCVWVSPVGVCGMIRHRGYHPVKPVSGKDGDPGKQEAFVPLAGRQMRVNRNRSKRW
jgi:hypothetical protein